MRVTLAQNDGFLFIDVATIEAVELIRSSRNSMNVQTGKPLPSKRDSLLGILDRTKTNPGKRFLRRTLLEPPAELDTISARQNLVEELSENEAGYFAICEALARFPDLEAVLSKLLAREVALTSKYAAPHATVPAQSQRNTSQPLPTTAQSVPPSANPATTWTPGKALLSGVANGMSPPSANLIRNVLQVKAALDAVPIILQFVERSSSSIMLAVAETLRSKHLSDLHLEIRNMLDEDAAPSRNAEHMRLQGAFAIRTGKNGHLDVARKTLSENIEDMHRHLNRLREQLDNPRINLTMNARRGYHFSAPSASMDCSELGEDFVQVQASGKVVRFSTNNLVELNARANESLAEIWTLTDRELGTLMDTLWATQTARALHRLCDSIAILDAMSSLVSYSSLSSVPTTRPKITRGGPIAIRAGHHPILGERATQDSVPNDIFLTETSALQVITGRNNSGKSTFMRSVALHAILAHIGCSVPATFASIRVLQNVCTRFSTSDDVAASQSHHSKEMQEISAILRVTSMPRRSVAHPHSLVLVDELGRSTTAADGFSIAYAVAEKLASTPNVLTLFATHFAALGALRHTWPIVKSCHLVTQRSDKCIYTKADSQHHEAKELNDLDKCAEAVMFTHKVADGPNPETHYGIESARAAGVPQSVILRALELRSALPAQRMSSVDQFHRTHLLTEENTRAIHRRKQNAAHIAEQLSHIRASMTNTSDGDVRAELLLLQEKVRTAHVKSRTRTAM